MESVDATKRMSVLPRTRDNRLSKRGNKLGIFKMMKEIRDGIKPKMK